MTAGARTLIGLSRRTLLMGAAGSAAVPRAFAQERGTRDLRDILNAGSLRVATPGFSSLPFFSAAGSRDAGLDVEMSREIAAALEVELAFDRSANTFDAAVELVARGRTDLAVCKLSRTLKRGRIIRYSQPYATLHHGLITNRVRFARLAGGRPAEDVVRDFRGDLGVIAHSSFAEFARTSFPGARIREFADWSSMVEAVRSEEIDMAYRDDFEIKKLLVDDPSMTVVARSITLSDRLDTLAIGIRPDAPHLAAFADLFLDLARGGAVMKTDEIIARYMAERGA
ncbi:substrate-binding periplasmic protein [Propylenella binzhouense]|uniref:Transporter substrate-binding domain-containing protein n=1 Tax=Propylenella binzhouense TaxID=2555902 RepID=A0A964T544_9HYPH|nr:transporter substrate-binding domain-containing protein [Propylenella binzhouense]MYZ48628.1 transporter substrate-binding domain-containing protein [Propylenella binzhouense]